MPTGIGDERRWCLRALAQKLSSLAASFEEREREKREEGMGFFIGGFGVTVAGSGSEEVARWLLSCAGESGGGWRKVMIGGLHLS
jgi:hypothetical protein